MSSYYRSFFEIPVATVAADKFTDMIKAISTCYCRVCKQHARSKNSFMGEYYGNDAGV
jgi:hypothetical protein